MQGDPGVDDGHVGVDPLVHAVDLGDRVQLADDPRDAGRHGLGGHVDDLVGDDRDDVRVGD